jgi:hypothetical protein
MQPQYMGRTMKCYPLHESEMGTLSILNTQATVFFSAATGAFGYAVSIWTNAAFAGAPTETARIATHTIAPLVAIAGVVFSIIALICAVQRRGVWERIKKESVTLHAAPAPEA